MNVVGKFVIAALLVALARRLPIPKMPIRTRPYRGPSEPGVPVLSRSR